MIAPGTKVCDLEAVAERIRSNMAAKVIEVNGIELHVTASVGGAVAVPAEDWVDREQFSRSLIECADRAMYDCKRAGRNQCKVIECTSEQLRDSMPPANSLSASTPAVQPSSSAEAPA